MRALLFSLALAACAAPALAQDPGSSLTLKTPGSTPAQTIIDGAAWTCQGATCTAPAGGASQPADRACRRVVSQLGAVNSFTWQGQTLSAERVGACNSAARR